MWKKQALAIAMGGLMGLSCSNDNTGSRPQYSSGVTSTTTPGTTTVSTLNDTQLQQICTTLDAHVQANIGFEAIAYIACLPPAIVLGGTAAGCEQRLSDCMSAFPKPIAIEAQLTDQNVCFADLRACEATVTALEGCVNVNLDLVFDILDNWSCSGAAQQGSREAAARAMDTVDVCADLSDACNRFANVSVQ